MPNTEVDVVNPPAFDELRKRADDGPVQMLNLLDFKPDGGAERYAEYSAAVAPLLEKAGARVIYAGSGGLALIGPSEWDVVALVEYPSRRAFIEMTSSPAYLKIAHLRAEALERAELHPLDQVDAPVI
jgi:uncharacterized protein (DUF1330 family)